MELLKSNYFDTTSLATINSNTSTVANLLDRDTFVQYFSSGFNNDATTVSLTITFGSTTYVSRIAMLEHNLKAFTIFYNGATANTFSLSTTADTTVSNYSTNSATSQYFRCNTVACTSITLDMKSTQAANAEKALGYYLLTDTKLLITHFPSARNFKPKIVPKQIVHQLSDGGTRLHTIRDKYETTIKYHNISTTFRDSLRSVYDDHETMWFCPFGTSTGWDKFLFECVWQGPFTFLEFSDNATAAGYSGEINLKETPN